MSVIKLRHASDRDAKKKENNMQYRTYYRNEYNRDKKKKRTFTALKLGMGESNKDTTVTQSETTPTM